MPLANSFALQTIHDLPPDICNSAILTHSNLLQLLTVSQIPTIDPTFTSDTLKNIVQYYSINPIEMERELHIYAKTLLDEGQVADAWQVLLVGDNY